MFSFSGPSGGCVDSTLNFLNSSPTNYTFTWKVDGNTISNQYNEDVSFSSIGSHTVSLIASNGITNSTLQKTFQIVFFTRYH